MRRGNPNLDRRQDVRLHHLALRVREVVHVRRLEKRITVQLDVISCLLTHDSYELPGNTLLGGIVEGVKHETEGARERCKERRKWIVHLADRRLLHEFLWNELQQQPLTLRR